MLNKNKVTDRMIKTGQPMTRKERAARRQLSDDIDRHNAEVDRRNEAANIKPQTSSIKHP